MTTLEDRAAITDVAHRMLWCVDARDWDGLHAVFADRVALDYSTLVGGDPQEATAAGIIADWSALLGAFDATQHLLANPLVTAAGDRGELRAAFQATHRLANPHGSPLWTLGGTYLMGMTRTDGAWRIDRLVMSTQWGDGNKDLLALVAG